MTIFSMTQSRLKFCTAPRSPNGTVNTGPRWWRSRTERRLEQLHRALVAAALDVLADAERVVQHVEDARQHVLHQRLRAEADGDAEDAGAGDQRHDLHAQPDSTVSAATTPMNTASALLKIGNRVRSRPLRAISSVLSPLPTTFSRYSMAALERHVVH